MPVRALRGAITCDADSREEIESRTQRLVTEMLDRNGIGHDDLIFVLFTATDDLTAMFPAAAVRAIGLGDVPLLCARELAVTGGMPRTIRVLMLFETDRARSALRHVYLEGAHSLRDDLPGDP